MQKTLNQTLASATQRSTLVSLIVLITRLTPSYIMKATIQMNGVPAQAKVSRLVKRKARE